MTEDQTGAPMDGDAELLDLLAGLSDTELDTALAGLPDAAIEPLLARLGEGTRYTAESPLDQAQVIDATFRTRPHLRYLSDRLAQAVRDVEGGTSRFLAVSMPPRMGKQIADSVPVLTTRGWTTHGDLSVGDEVFSPSGLPVRVQGVSAPSEEKVRVVFTDGSEVACHPLHEWVVFDRSRGAWRTVETRYLMSRELWNGPHGARGGRATFQLPPVSPVQFPHREYLPVDPYTLGVWLGDGTASKASICGAEEDLNLIMARVPYELGARWVHPDTGVHYQYVKGGFLAALRSAGVLGDKHVPEQYLLASEDQRRALLAGLVDTDGTVDVTGRVTVSSSSHRLASGIRALVRSLGYRAGLVAVPADTREGRAIRGGPYWAVSWTIHDGIPAGAALQRKRGTWTKIKRRVGIAAIEPAPDELGRCIQVEGGVYLVGDALLPTHNSSLCSIYLPTWVLARHPSWKLGLISHSPTLSTSWGRQVRRMVENPALDLGVTLASDAGAVAQWETTARGSVSARSMPGQSVTGLGFNVLLVDDPVKDIASAHSETAREANWDWWQANAVTRLEHPALVVVIGTRWHEDDLIGRLLSEEYGDAAQAWEVIEFPAIAEVDDVLGRTPGQPLLSPLVENETDEQALARWSSLRTAVGSYNWSALYQQRPSPAEGAIFNVGWWRYWTTNPANATADGRVVYVDPLDSRVLADGSTPTDTAASGRRAEGEWLDSWDCAFKGTDTSDFVVGQRWLRRGQYRYLIDQRRGRWTFTQTLDQIEGFGNGGAFGDRVHRILVEDKANGTAVMDVMRDRLTGLTPISPKDGKEVRARAVTPEVESGHVLLPYPGDPGNEWVSDLLSEARNFPNTAHDDQVDALTQALNYLRNTTGRSGGISNPAQHGRRPAGGSLAAARRQSGARPGSGLSGVRR